MRLLAAAVLLGLGCWNPALAADEDIGDAVVTASIAEPSTLVPLVAADSASHSICALLFNGLVKYDKTLRLIPPPPPPARAPRRRFPQHLRPPVQRPRQIRQDAPPHRRPRRTVGPARRGSDPSVPPAARRPLARWGAADGRRRPLHLRIADQPGGAHPVPRGLRAGPVADGGGPLDGRGALRGTVRAGPLELDHVDRAAPSPGGTGPPPHAVRPPAGRGRAGPAPALADRPGAGNW